MALCSTSRAEAGASTAVQAKRKTILEDWDKRRVVELGDEAASWEVLYCSTGLFICSFSFCFPLFFCFHLLGGSNSILHYTLDPNKTPAYTLQGGQMRQVRCEKKEFKNVHVPLFELSALTLSSQQQ